MDNQIVHAPLCGSLLKALMGHSLLLSDLAEVDKVYHGSLSWMQDNDITGIIFDSFTVEAEQFGETRVVELVPGGAGMAVVEENKHLYVQAAMQWRVLGSIRAQLSAFLSGFHELVPRAMLDVFDARELSTLLNGRPEVRNELHLLKTAVHARAWVKNVFCCRNVFVSYCVWVTFLIRMHIPHSVFIHTCNIIHKHTYTHTHTHLIHSTHAPCTGERRRPPSERIFHRWIRRGVQDDQALLDRPNVPEPGATVAGPRFYNRVEPHSA